MDHAGQFGAFLLSFVVIARLWWAHHRLGELLTVVVLPFATQVVAAHPATALPVATYVGTMTLSSACVTVLDARVLARGELRREGMTEHARAGLVGGAVTTGLFALALVLGVAVRAVDHYGLLLLLLSGPLERLVLRARR